MRGYGVDKPDRRIPPMHPVEGLFSPKGSLSAPGLPLVAVRVPHTGALSPAASAMS